MEICFAKTAAHEDQTIIVQKLMEMDLSILTSFFCRVHVVFVAKVVFFMFFCQEMLGVKPCISCLGGYGYGRSVTGQDWKCLRSQWQAEAFHGHLQLLRQHLGACAVPNRSKLIKADQTWSKLIELSENDQEISSCPHFLGLSFDSLVWGKWYNFMENQLGWSPHGARHWIQLTLTASGFLWRFFLRWEHLRLQMAVEDH